MRKYGWYTILLLLALWTPQVVAQDAIFVPFSILELDDTPTTFSGQANKCAIVNGDEDAIEFGACASGSGGNAPSDAPYLTLSTDGSLSAERVLTAGEGIDFADDGAGSTLTVSGEDASSSNKGIATFNNDNFSVSSGDVTIKDNGIILATETTGSFVQDIVGGNGISSTGASTGENIEHTLSVDLMTSASNGASSTTGSVSGLEFVSGELTLIQGCSDGQLLKWREDIDQWDCETISSGGLGNVVEDATPQLGGDLDAQENDITDLTELQFHTTPAATPTGEGSVYWDADNHTLAIQPDEADSTLQTGQENWIRVYNDSGGTINNGEVVYVSGKEDVEDRLTIAKAQADADNTSRVLGFATHDIEDSSFGYITQFGYVNDLDTSSFSDGEPIWLSADTAGAFTNLAPSSPNNAVFLGFISDSHASTGNLFITTLGNTSGDVVINSAEMLVTRARKGSAGTITKGQAVYITGYNTGQDAVEIELADADGSGTYPAIGLADDTITNSTNGNVVFSGRIANVDTSSFSVNDALYLSTTAGALTSTRPTGATACIQGIARVHRVHATLGVMKIIGAERCNDESNSIDPDRLAGDTTDDDLVDIAVGGTSASTASGARTALGLAIGTNVQAFDAGLLSIAGLTTAADRMIYTTASDTYAVATLTSAARSILDDASTTAIRTTLGVGTGNSPQFTAVNIGHATDTTVARSSAGVITVEGVVVPTISSTNTITNKTMNADNNTFSNFDLGNEVDWAAADDVTTASAFESGDKLLAFEAGVGLRKIDYDDLPSGGSVARSITLNIDGGGSVITTGTLDAIVEMNYSMTIDKATLLLDTTGTLVVDVWKDTYANYPPTDADSITASAQPTVNAGTKSQDTTLTGWTTSVSDGDILRFYVDSADTVTFATLILSGS